MRRDAGPRIRCIMPVLLLLVCVPGRARETAASSHGEAQPGGQYAALIAYASQAALLV